MKYGKRLSKFQITWAADLFHHGREDSLLVNGDDDEREQLIDEIEHYVLKGRQDQIFRHLGFPAGHRNEKSLDYMREYFVRYYEKDMDLSTAELHQCISDVCARADWEAKLAELHSGMQNSVGRGSRD